MGSTLFTQPPQERLTTLEKQVNIRKVVPEIGVVLVGRVAVVEDDRDGGGAVAAARHHHRPLRDRELVGSHLMYKHCT